MSDLRAGVEITADVSDLNTKLTQAKATLQGYEAQLRSTAAALAKAGVEEGAAARAMADLAAKTTSARNSVQQIETQLRAMTGAAKDAAQAGADAGQKIGQGMDHARVMTAGASREIIVIAHEMLQGRFSRIPGSVMVLSERMGNLHGIIAGLAGPTGVMIGLAGGLAAGFYLIAKNAYEAEKAMRGVYNAQLLGGGGSAAGAEAGARAGGAALARSGVMGTSAANDYAAAVYKMRDLTDLQKQQLISMGAAIYIASDKSDKAAIAFAENFGKEASHLKHFIEEYGLATAEQAKTVDKATSADELRAIALGTLQTRLSGASAALKDVAKMQSEAQIGAAVGGFGSFMPAGTLVPSRLPEVPAGARPSAIAEEMRLAREQPSKMQQIHERVAEAEYAAVAKGGANQKALLEAQRQAGIAVLREALNDDKLNAKERLQVQAELNLKLTREAIATAGAGAAASHKDYEAFAAKEREKIAEAKGSADRIMAIYEEWLGRAKKQFGEESAEYQRVKTEEVKAAQHAAEQKLAIEAAFDHLQKARFPGAAQTLQAERHAARAAEQFAKPFRTMFDQLGNDLETALTSAVTGSSTMAQIETTLYRSLMSGVIKGGIGILSRVGGGLLGGGPNEGVGDVTGNAASSWLGRQLGSLLPDIGAKAAEDAPLVGALAANTGAVLANTAALGGGAAASLGGLLAFSKGGIVPSIPSAAGGMMVPGNTLALLHAREMVLPAGIADGVKNMTEGGGRGGGETHLHFHGPADGPAIERFLTPYIRRNLPGAMAQAFPYQPV